jgi:Chaperone of endosialidase
MGGSTKTTQQKHETSVTSPWEPARPAAEDVLARLSGRASDMELSGLETDGLGRLRRNALAGNPYASRIGLLADDLFAAPDHTGQVADAYKDLRTGLLPYASGANLDPGRNPYFQNYLADITRSAREATDAQFMSAGRDLSPSHIGMIAERIARGTAPAFAQAYDAGVGRQLGAIDALFRGGLSSAATSSQLDAARNAARAAGIDVSQSALNAADSADERLLALEQRRRMLPLQNLGLLANLIVPMAQLGGKKVTESIETGEKKEPLLQQLLGGAASLGRAGAFGPQGWLYSSGSGMLNGLAGGAGAAGAGIEAGFTAAPTLAGMSAAAPMAASSAPAWLSAMTAAPFALSDRRLKRDIAVVGALHDGTPVYRFRYLNGPAMHIGLMADDVEKIAPEAVHLVGGVKFLDYEIATERALDR